MFEAFDASASGLYSERVRLTAIANNLANIHTTRGPNGEKNPFRRKLVVQMEGNPNNSNPNYGVQVKHIVGDQSDFILKHDPSHPDALRHEDFFTLDGNGEITDQRRPEYASMTQYEFDRLVKQVGYVRLPNVSPVQEMKDAMISARAYEANVAAVNNSKSLISESLSIIA